MSSLSLLRVISGFIILTQLSGAVGVEIGRVGREFQQDVDIIFPDEPNRFYVDTQFPAETSGMIYNLSYCYSPPEFSTNLRFYQAIVGFYREGDDENYIRVSNTFNITVPSPRSSPSSSPSSTQCGTLSIPGYNIQEGQVLGVCSREFRGDGIGRLNLVASDDDDNGGIGLRRSEAREDVNRLCESPGTLPEETRRNDYRNDEGNVLLLFGNIEVAVTPTGSVDTVPVTDATTQTVTTAAKIADATVLEIAGSDNNKIIVIVVVILVILIFLTCIISCLIVIILLKKQKKKAPDNSHGTLGQSLIAIETNRAYAPTIMDIQEVQYQPAESVLDLSYELHTSYTAIEQISSDSETILPYEHTSTDGCDGDVDDGGDAGACAGGFYDGHGEEACEYEYSLVGGKRMTGDRDANFLFNIMEQVKLNQERDIYEGLSPFSAPANKERALYNQLKKIGKKSIRREELEHVRSLGSGQFGLVQEAIWRRRNMEKNVALKTLNKKAVCEENKLKFLQEAVLMAQFKHPNIISLYGVVNIGESIMLVLELATRGDLLHTLRLLKPDPEEMIPFGLCDVLLSYSQHIALGMQYLSSKRFVHRDLAGRNVLVTKDNICKISDFGLSRDLEENSDYYISRGGQVPVKWTAPEALYHRKYSTASDVWSYGCVLYEIWSLGTKPFMNMKNLDVIKYVRTGKRLHSPPGCPIEIYKLMMLCWKEKPVDRPIFRDIVNILVQDKVLSIPLRELSTHPQAGILGAPLEAGANLYKAIYNSHSTVSLNEDDNNYESIQHS